MAVAFPYCGFAPRATQPGPPDPQGGTWLLGVMAAPSLPIPVPGQVDALRALPVCGDPGR